MVFTSPITSSISEPRPAFDALSIKYFVTACDSQHGSEVGGQKRRNQSISGQAQERCHHHEPSHHLLGVCRRLERHSPLATAEAGQNPDLSSRFKTIGTTPTLQNRKPLHSVTPSPRPSNPPTTRDVSPVAPLSQTTRDERRKTEDTKGKPRGLMAKVTCTPGAKLQQCQKQAR